MRTSNQVLRLEASLKLLRLVHVVVPHHLQLARFQPRFPLELPHRTGEKEIDRRVATRMAARDIGPDASRWPPTSRVLLFSASSSGQRGGTHLGHVIGLSASWLSSRLQVLTPHVSRCLVPVHPLAAGSVIHKPIVATALVPGLQFVDSRIGAAAPAPYPVSVCVVQNRLYEILLERGQHTRPERLSCPAATSSAIKTRHCRACTGWA
jgi:hypothetical protein